MATIQQNGSAVTSKSTNNNHGTAKNVGRVSSVLENRNLGNPNVGVFGSTVVDGSDTDKGLNSGVFAYNNNDPVAMRLTISLATVSNSILRSASNVPSQLRSINKRESYKSSGNATAFRAGYFNLYTGKYSPAPTPTTENPGTDNAASPTRSVPGTLRFKTGKLVAVAKNYAPKNG